MRLKTSQPPTTTTYTPPASLTAPVSQTPTTTSVTPVASSVRQQKQSRRRWSVARVALWACFLTPLVVIGNKVSLSQFQTRVLEARIPEASESILAPYGHHAISGVFSPDGQTLAMVDAPLQFSGQIRPQFLSFWNWKTKQAISPRIALPIPGMPLIFRKSGQEILLVGSLSTAYSMKIGEWILRPEPRPFLMDVSPDGTRAIKGKQVVDAQTGKALANLVLPQSRQTLVTSKWAFSPRNTYVSLLAENIKHQNQLTIWKVGQEKPLWVHENYTPYLPVIFSQDETRLLANRSRSIETKSVVCLETATGKVLWDSAGSTGLGVATVKGGFVLVGNGIVALDGKTGQITTSLPKTSSDSMIYLPSQRLSISPDGTTIAQRRDFGIHLRRIAGGN